GSLSHSTTPRYITTRDTEASGERVRRLHRRIELRRVAALLARPVARALAPAERRVIIHTRSRQVDHHHASLRVALEMRRVLEARRADAGAKAERRIVRDRQRRFIVPGAHDGRDRPENFLARDPHVVAYVGEERRRHVEARRIAREAVAAGDE